MMLRSLWPVSFMKRRSAPSGVDNAAAAPAFGAVGTHSPTSIVAAYPTGITAGQLLEITIYTVGGATDTAYSASGWTAGPTAYDATGQSGSNVTFKISTLWKIATGSESGSVTVTMSGTNPGRHYAVCKRYTGVNTSSPYEATTSNYTANTSGVGANSGSVTTLGTGRLLVNHWVGNPTASQTWNVGSGWTQDYAFSSFQIGPDYQTFQSHKTASGTGAQSAESMTTTMTGDDIFCMSYAIKGTP